MKVRDIDSMIRAAACQLWEANDAMVYEFEHVDDRPGWSGKWFILFVQYWPGAAWDGIARSRSKQGLLDQLRVSDVSRN